MKVSPPVAIISLLAAAMVFLAYAKPDRGICIADPAGESHWSAATQRSSTVPNCDPWRFVRVKQPIARITAVYTNGTWQERSRQLVVERTGRIALMRELRPMLGEWQVDHEVHDLGLARMLLGQLGPLTSYNRYDFKSRIANPQDPFLTDSPRTHCDHLTVVLDSGAFELEATTTDGETWWSVVDGGCVSVATDVATKRLANAFAMAVKRTGAGPAYGETFYMPLD